MALIRRVSRLLRADLHAVLDQLEEPDILLRQSIREMEQALADDEARHKRLQRRIGDLARQEQEIARALDDSDEELDLCFENGAESLAKGLIRRRLESEQRKARLATQRSDCQQKIEALEQALAENRNRLEQTRQQAELVVRELATETPQPQGYRFEPVVAEQQVELALMREKQKRGLS
jgi:phage shock protein A